MLYAKGGGMLLNIGQILKKKGSEVWCIAPEAKAYDALSMMAEKGIGALVVVEEGRVVGLLGERDFILKVDLSGLSSRTASVRQVMSENVYSVTPGTTIDEAMAIVTASHCRHLPVIVTDQLVGLVSIGDLVKTIIAEQQYLIAQLERYIRGEL